MPTPLITVAEARALVLEAVTPLPVQSVGIDEGLDRVLAADVVAVADVPPFACSAMDGYAVIAGPAGRALTVVGESRAGAPADRAVGEGEAIRISTGAAVPPGATAVIPQEDIAQDSDGRIITRADLAAGDHVRTPGEDMRAGTRVLSAGTRLGPFHLGAATAAGVARLTVARRPRTAVLSTGDELRAPGEPLGPGEIHNSNAPMLTGMCLRSGATAAPARRLPDDPEATRAGIDTALNASDVVILTGGVSVGPHDHVKPALDALGVQQRFWRVALQPGKPTWFGTLSDGRLVFGLPGNPVSAVVTFSLFVAPALAALQGTDPPPPPHPRAALGVTVRANPQREQAVRVRLRADGAALTAVPTGAQGSHILTSLVGADALAMIPAGDAPLPAGTLVDLHALAG